MRAKGYQQDILYLNSERDYRDQRIVSIAISPAARVRIEAAFGGELSKAAIGKRIVAAARAQRVPIWFYDADGKRSDKLLPDARPRRRP